MVDPVRVEPTVIAFTVSVLVTSVEVMVLVAYNVGANNHKLPLIVSTVMVEQSIVDKYASRTNAFVTEDNVEHVIVEPIIILLFKMVFVDNVVQLTVAPVKVVNTNDPALILDAVNVELTVKKLVVTVLPNIVENPMDRAEMVLPLKVELPMFPENMVEPASVEKVIPPAVMVEPNMVEKKIAFVLSVETVAVELTVTLLITTLLPFREE